MKLRISISWAAVIVTVVQFVLAGEEADARYFGFGLTVGVAVGSVELETPQREPKAIQG